MSNTTVSFLFSKVHIISNVISASAPHPWSGAVEAARQGLQAHKLPVPDGPQGRGDL